MITTFLPCLSLVLMPLCLFKLYFLPFGMSYNFFLIAKHMILMYWVKGTPVTRPLVIGSHHTFYSSVIRLQSFIGL